MSFNNFNEPGRVEVDVTWDFSDDGDNEQELTVFADFTPGRQAPPCSDHDSPAFSDSGDPAEWRIVKVTDKRDGSEVPGMVWKMDEGFDEAVGEALVEDLIQHRHERAYARVDYI